MAAMCTDSALHRAIPASRIFAVHVVGKNQKELAMAYFKGAEPSDGLRNGYRTAAGGTGATQLMAVSA
jgi:hypothetical protein